MNQFVDERGRAPECDRRRDRIGPPERDTPARRKFADSLLRRLPMLILTSALSSHMLTA
jgi:hypothetical protein